MPYLRLPGSRYCRAGAPPTARRAPVMVALLAGFLTTTGIQAHAQTPQPTDSAAAAEEAAIEQLDVGQLMGELTEKVERLQGDTLQLSPAVVVVTPHDRTVTIQVVNFGADTIKAAVRVQYAAPSAVGPDSSEKTHSLAAWIQDAPTSLTLAPQEKRTLTLHLVVPKALQAGEYSAHLVSEFMPVGYQIDSASGQIAISAGGAMFSAPLPEELQSPAARRRAVKIVFRAGK